MERMEAVIFDWAGTTVDFGCFAPVQAFMEAFKSAGILPVLEEVRKPMGLSKEELEGISKEEYREAYNRTAMVYRKAGADYVIGSMKELPELIRILEKQA